MLVVALILAGMASVNLARPALGCTIAADRTEEDHRRAAELIFTGTAVRVDDPTNGRTFSSADPLYWTFVVDGLEKGEG